MFWVEGFLYSFLLVGGGEVWIFDYFGDWRVKVGLRVSVKGIDIV